MPRLFAFLLIYFILIIPPANAQQRVGSFIAYGREAGLPPSLNYAVLQSSDGYLWIGTSSGLVRFDGRRYKTFFFSYIDNNSPSDNTIIDLAEDKYGHLWFCGSSNGVTMYDPRTGKFIQYPRLSADKTNGYGIYDICKDKNGELWFATAGRGLAHYLYGKNSFELFTPDPSKAHDGSVKGMNEVSGIAADRNNPDLLWLSCFDGLYSFNKKDHSFHKFSTPATEKNLFNCIETDTKNNIWLGTKAGGVFLFNISTNSFQHITSPDDDIADIRAVNDSVLYAAMGNQGILSINTVTKKTEIIDIPWPVATPDIRKISVTHSAGIFAGGSNYIYQLHPAYSRFSNMISFQRSKLNGDGKILLNNAEYDKGRNAYWMACYNAKGLYKFSSDFKKQEIVEAYENTLDEMNFHDVCVAGNLVLAVGEISGLWILDENDGKIQLARNVFPGSDTVFSKVLSVEADHKGNCWLFTGDKLLHWNIQQNTVQSFLLPRNPAYHGTDNISSEILRVDQHNNAWVATNIGLFFCDLSQGKVSHIIPEGKTDRDLASFFIKSLTIDKYGNPWVGFNGEGLQIVSGTERVVISYHTIDGGLPAMHINYLATDTAGRIWAATNPGLALFDPQMKQWQVFNKLDGIARDNMDRPVIGCSNGTMILDQVNGFAWLDCSKFRSSDDIPKIHITSLKVNDQEYADSVLPDYLSRIELPYNTNDLNIEFAAMDWLYPSRTRYYFLVDGIHAPSSWMITEGYINLAGLKPGHYRLRIKALNSNGYWSNEDYQKYLEIIIAPPFWQRWWFIAICIALLAALFYAIYRYRVNQILRLQKIRNNISQNLHDDIGASLSNINILNELTRRNLQDETKAKSYLAKAGDDIQRISESLSDIVWNVNPRYDELANLFIRMKRYAADMTDGKQINCELIFPDEDQHITMSMDKRRDFYMIFKEALNNLAKHSKATEARVQVELRDRKLIMEIADNGRGFDEKEKGTGNGLQNMRQRAAKWNAALSVTSKPGSGTTVKLEMKL